MGSERIVQRKPLVLGITAFFKEKRYAYHQANDLPRYL